MRTIKLVALSLSVTVAVSFAVHAHGRIAQQQDSKSQDLFQQQTSTVKADIELTADNYTTWRDHIQPDLSELAWEDIPWLTTFKDGIAAADAADKPLLLWTMNGHPLGCT
ncbi:MAG: hypothetical protein MPJ50_18645 [Pirellulales bacterium]|nr:hypothetical protein [Pirellulales bacterium]